MTTAAPEIRVFTCPQCGRVKPCRCNIMDDQAEQYSSYDGPAADSQGARGTLVVEESTAKRDREATLLRIIHRLLTMLDTQGVSMDVNLTDSAPLGSVSLEGLHYDVRQGKKGIGS